MRRKSIYFVPIIFVIVLWMLNIYSCKDNPVNTQQFEGLDSARFNVSRQNVSHGWFSYIIDSNNIFLGDFPDLLYIKNNSYIYLSFGDNFSCRNMGGINEEIYFVGQSFGEQIGFEKPRMKKWTGMGFEEIPIIDSSNRYYFLNCVYLRKNNELWLGGSKGNVLKYINGNFTKYQFDTTYTRRQFFEDQNNNIYFWECKDSSNYEGTYCKRFQNFYKLGNQNWELIYTHIAEMDSIRNESIMPAQVGNAILAVGLDGIYKFDGISYKKINSIYSINFNNPFFGISGSGLDNYMVLGYEGDWSNKSFFHWNGKKWSKEYSGNNLTVHVIRYASNCFIAVTFYYSGLCDFIKFTKK